MTRITWIIIFLIVVSICVTCLEVILRFAILTSKKGVVPVEGMGEMGTLSVGSAGGPLKGLLPTSYAGPSLLMARGLVWVARGVKGLFA